MKGRFYAVLLLAGLAASCKKDKVVNNTPAPTTGGTTTTPAPTGGSALDLMKDSVFLYSKEDYYWNTQLPDYATFNPRGFTGSDDLTALQKEVNALSQYARNPATNQPYEYSADYPGEAKYSNILTTEALGRLSANSLAAVASTGDYGFEPIYIGLNDLRVAYVNPGSPAETAGLKRGYQITAINGSTAVGYSNASYVGSAVSSNTTISLTLKKADGTSFDARIAASYYKINPILKTSIFDVGNGKKVGYLVFNSYVALDGVKAGLDNAFSAFATSGVTDLVIDLRYNGGGYVETAEYLDDLIAPSSLNGRQMYTVYYNANLVNGTAPLLKNQVRRDASSNQLYNYSQINYSPSAQQSNFAKKGNLNSLTKVVFLVSDFTASASELTINNLLPHMSVQLIGTTTYGKPVGFFDININKYTLLTPEFETKNSAGQGGYYAGMTPGTTTYPGKVVGDDVTKDFGDATERMLDAALGYIRTGTFAASLRTESTSGIMLTKELKDANASIDKHHFRGMLFKDKFVHK